MFEPNPYLTILIILLALFVATVSIVIPAILVSLKREKTRQDRESGSPLGGSVKTPPAA